MTHLPGNIYLNYVVFLLLNCFRGVPLIGKKRKETCISIGLSLSNVFLYNYRKISGFFNFFLLLWFSRNYRQTYMDLQKETLCIYRGKTHKHLNSIFRLSVLIVKWPSTDLRDKEKIRNNNKIHKIHNINIPIVANLSLKHLIFTINVHISLKNSCWRIRLVFCFPREHVALNATQKSAWAFYWNAQSEKQHRRAANMQMWFVAGFYSKTANCDVLILNSL